MEPIIIDVNLHVSHRVREALRKASKELGMSQQKIIAEALTDWLDSMGYLEGE